MVFAVYTECKACELQKDHDTRKSKPIFFPTLVVNPVNTIHQTHKELKSNFPTLNVSLYYAGTAQSKKFDGATIITIRYSTLHTREITKS